MSCHVIAIPPSYCVVHTKIHKIADCRITSVVYPDRGSRWCSAQEVVRGAIRFRKAIHPKKWIAVQFKLKKRIKLEKRSY